MVVRVKARVEYIATGRSTITSALVNTGFGTRRPTVRLPLGLAQELGLGEEDIRGAEAVEFIVGDGRVAFFPLLRDAVRISVVTEDRVEGPVIADAIVLEQPGELVLSDTLTQLLKVVPVLPGDGLWCFLDERPERLRRSAERQVWRPRASGPSR